MSGESNSQSLGQAVQSAIQRLSAAAPGTIGDRFRFSLTDWDEGQGCFRFRCETETWMANVAGTLHGGIGAAAVDQAMGYVAYCIQPGPGFSPTVQMQLSYHRPLFPGRAMEVKVYVVSRGKTLMHLRAEAAQADAPDRLCLSATGIYRFLPTPAKK